MVASVLFGLVVCLCPILLARSEDRSLRRAARLLAKEHYGDAERAALTVLKTSPESGSALLVAGEAMANNHSGH